MAYPSSLDSFTDPAGGTSLVASGPDHAALHGSINSAVEAIESATGTHSGTNVLKNFVAGNFPARINASNVLQQRVSGTIDNAILGTPAISSGTIANAKLIGTSQITGGTVGTASVIGGTVSSAVVGTNQIQGGTVGNALLGTPKITIGSDAAGDMYYRDSGGSIARVGIGTPNQSLTVSAGTLPSWTTGAVAGFQSGCRVKMGAGQTISTDVLLNFDTEDYDLGNEWNTTNKNFIVGTAGKYLCMVTLNINNPPQEFRAFIYYNGGIEQGGVQNASGAGYPTVSAMSIVTAAVGGTISFHGAMTSGSGTINTDANYTKAYIQRII